MHKTKIIEVLLMNLNTIWIYMEVTAKNKDLAFRAIN